MGTLSRDALPFLLQDYATEYTDIGEAPAYAASVPDFAERTSPWYTVFVDACQANLHLLDGKVLVEQVKCCSDRTFDIHANELISCRYCVPVYYGTNCTRECIHH